jgi:hypothetical protein
MLAVAQPVGFAVVVPVREQLSDRNGDRRTAGSGQAELQLESEQPTSVPERQLERKPERQPLVPPEPEPLADLR